MKREVNETVEEMCSGNISVELSYTRSFIEVQPDGKVIIKDICHIDEIVIKEDVQPIIVQERSG